MAARSNGSATIRLRDVAIPVKLYTATTEKSIGFNMLHAKKVSGRGKCGSRVKQILTCADENKPIERADVVWGYEYSPEKFVTFTNDELATLELEGDPDTIAIAEIVPAASIPLTNVYKAIYLGPDKGAARSYRLIALALERANAVAVGQIGGQKRDELVVVRPHEGGLALHRLYYANEVRSFAELEVETDLALSAEELALADRLVDGMLVDAFDASRFTDEAAARLSEAVARKVAGKQIVVPPPEKGAKPLDLLEQLRRSVGGGPRKTCASRTSPVSGPRTAAARRTG